MTRARRQIQEKLKLIDVVIELLDARLPLSSRNPMIDEILQGKPRMILLNKADLADPAITRQWIDYFKEEGFAAVAVDASSGQGVKEIPAMARELLKDKIEKQLAKGMNPRAVRALIVGIPNVGKSTLFNKLIGEQRAVMHDVPGTTRDRLYGTTDWNGVEMTVVDTGGFVLEGKEEPLARYIRQQAQLKRIFHLAPGPDLRTVLSRTTRQRLREHAELVEAILRRIVRSGIEAGEFPAQDIDTTVQLVNACLSGRLVPDDPVAREQAIEATEAFVLRAVGADATSPALAG